MEPRRGQRRFWVTLEGRFRYYHWPEIIAAKCPNCAAFLPFSPKIRNCRLQEGYRYRMLDLPVGAIKDGAGSCTACGRSFNNIHWPIDAFYKSAVQGGEFWAWHEDYLHVLRARVAGDRVLERQLSMRGQAYHYFLSRLPKFVVLRRNREAILRKIDQWLGESARRT